MLGEDVQRTFQKVESGEADAGLVSMSLVQHQGGRLLSLGGTLHAPLTQVIVQCKHGKNPEGARAFDHFVASERGAAILRHHGSVVPAP